MVILKYSKKIIYPIVILSALVLTLIGVYLVNQNQTSMPFNHNDSVSEIFKKPTHITSKVFPQVAIITYNDLSVKGYLISEDGKGLVDKEIDISIDNVVVSGESTINTDMNVGKTKTNANGCFYFQEWDYEKIDSLLKDISKKATLGNPNHKITVRTNFPGDKDYVESSNITELKYYSMAIPLSVPKPAIASFLNGTSFIENLELKRGQSYDMAVYVLQGSSVSHEPVVLDIMNLPCGMRAEFTNKVNFGESREVVIPIKITLNEDTVLGEYTIFIVGNNYELNRYTLMVL